MQYRPLFTADCILRGGSGTCLQAERRGAHCPLPGSVEGETTAQLLAH